MSGAKSKARLKAAMGGKKMGGSAGGGGAPVFEGSSTITLDTLTVADAAAAGTVVGQLAVAPSVASLTLLNNAAGHFAINGSNQLVTTTTAPALADTSYTITVRAVRGIVVTDTNFTITVTA